MKNSGEQDLRSPTLYNIMYFVINKRNATDFIYLAWTFWWSGAFCIWQGRRVTDHMNRVILILLTCVGSCKIQGRF